MLELLHDFRADNQIPAFTKPAISREKSPATYRHKWQPEGNPYGVLILLPIVVKGDLPHTLITPLPSIHHPRQLASHLGLVTSAARVSHMTVNLSIWRSLACLRLHGLGLFLPALAFSLTRQYVGAVWRYCLSLPLLTELPVWEKPWWSNHNVTVTITMQGL